jgi:hypothetical protein
MAKIDENIKVMMLKGETGASIKSIDKTATDGLVDTYTVTLSDGTKSNFNVTNGKDGADFDTFEIGGRNLLLKSSTFGNFKGTADITLSDGILSFGTSGDIQTGVQARGIKRCLPFLRGKKVTTSYLVRTHESLASVADNAYFGAELGVMYADGSESYSDGRLSLSSEFAKADSKWRKVYVTHQLKDIEIVDAALSFLKRGITGAVDFTQPKLEIGTKPSDWTPAPEDKADEADLQSLSTKVAANTSGISKNASDISTLSAMSTLYSDDKWRVCVKCGFVWVYCNGVSTAGGAWDYTDCPYTLHEKYRPPMTLYAPAFANNGGTDTGAISVTRYGEISVGNYGGTGSTDARHGVLCWPIGI